MSDQILENEVYDSYQDHKWHARYREDCSTCFREQRLIKARKLVNNGGTSDGWQRGNSFDNYQSGDSS